MRLSDSVHKCEGACDVFVHLQWLNLDVVVVFMTNKNSTMKFNVKFPGTNIYWCVCVCVYEKTNRQEMD